MCSIVFCHSFKYQYFKSINIFAILIPATRLPMLNGMMYIVRPLMQPGNSVWIFLSSSEGEIQFPSLPWTPSAASGIVVILFGARRLPEIGSGVGKAIKNFKAGVTDPSEHTLTTYLLTILSVDRDWKSKLLSDELHYTLHNRYVGYFCQLSYD